MKKIGIMLTAAILAAIGISSCQESAEKTQKAIAYKIENKEALTADEYATVIDYVGQYAEKAQKYVDMQINGEDLTEAAAGMKKLNDEYPLVDTYRQCLRFTPCSDLSAENLELVKKYAGYVEFTAPSGYTIQTAGPEMAGLEEAVPDSANGVIAGAVDTTAVDRHDWH